MIWVLAVRCADQLPSSVRASGRSVPSRSEYIPGATSGGGSSGRSVLSAAKYVPGTFCLIVFSVVYDFSAICAMFYCIVFCG